MPGEELIELRDVPHPGGDHPGSLVYLVRNDFIEGVGIGMMLRAVPALSLYAEVGRYATALKRDMIRRAEGA